MTPAIAGWIVLGAFCVASLALMLAGALHVARAQRQLKAKVARLEEKQRATFDAPRLEAALARISSDAEATGDLIARARRALATIALSVRYFALTVRIVKLLT
ncbi:MAG TPA: hypothetical protein VFE36_08325 [Candidatus Baltobacteraceae bacterium]|jgi:hypothetical protein|nr:hypothetical protein [Candidatus Baltobacteraceae bacterium]